MKKIYKIILMMIGLLAIVFVSSLVQIKNSVQKACLAARSQYAGDCVGALMSYIQSSDHSFADKNTAIWALGQFADSRSLSILETLSKEAYRESPCDRDKYICLGEVKRAIEWSKNGNLISWMYKNNNNW